MNGWLALVQIDQPTVSTNRFRWELRLDVYVVPRAEERLTIPFHRCSGALEFPPPISQGLSMEEVSLWPYYSRTTPSRPRQKLSVTAESTPTEVHFHGPANVCLTAVGWSPAEPSIHIPEVRGSINLLPIGAERPVPIAVTLRHTAPEGGASVIRAWRLGKHPGEWDNRWA
jgi:hypothetical protein